MIVINRRVDQAVVIDDGVTITVMDLSCSNVLLGVSVPPRITVREEEAPQQPDTRGMDERPCIRAEDAHKIPVGLSADGMPDEVMARGVDVHLERMDEHTWWMKIEQDHCRLILWFHGVEEVSAAHDCGEYP